MADEVDYRLGDYNQNKAMAKAISDAQAADTGYVPVAGLDASTASLVNTGGSATDVALKGRFVVAATVTTSGALVTGKHNPVDATSGALIMTLPASPASGAHLSVEKVDATANAVTVSGSIRGVTTTIGLVLQHETLELVADASGSWWPVAGHKTKASLDATYALMGQFDPRRYGTVDISGSTDSSTAVLAAIADWQTTGGEMSWPAGTIRVDSQIALTYDADAQPKQKSGVWRGRGATFNGTGTAQAAGATPANGGTVLDLRYAGAGAKIDTRGLGLLEVTGITFTDNGTSSTPFFHTTNTTLQIHNNAFIGNPTKSLTTCDQDAIILGGTNTGMPTNSDPQSPFQGYGTVIKENYFARIRRGVLVQTYGNSIVIRDNTWWANCGSNLAGGAAIEFAPTGSNYCVGNSVTDNLIECTGYAYGITADWTTNCWFAANHFWDYGANMVAGYHFGDHGQFNTIVAGAATDTKHLIEETVASMNTNTVINGHQTMQSTFPQLLRFTNNVAPMVIGGGGVNSVSSSGDLALVVCAPGNYPYPEIQLNTVMRSQVTDGVTTSGSPVITSATAAWTVQDKGMPVSGAGIPAGAVILSRQSPTQVTLSKSATATASAVTLGFGHGIPQNGQVSQVGFARQHMVTKGAAGAAGAYGAAGAGATCTTSGTDMAFTVTLTTGTGPTAGQQCYLPFGTIWSGTPKLVFSPKNAAAASAMATSGIYMTNTNANAFIQTVSALPASTSFIFDVIAVQ